MRHIILIACHKPYDDIPIFESKTYQSKKLDDVLHNLRKVNAFFFIVLFISIKKFCFN